MVLANDVIREILKLGVMNQDEQGGCVYCGGAPEDGIYATEALEDHDENCVWVLANKVELD